MLLGLVDLLARYNFCTTGNAPERVSRSLTISGGSTTILINPLEEDNVRILTDKSG